MPTEINATALGLDALGTFNSGVDTSAVFAHTQNAYITYTQVSATNLDGGWPAGAETKKFFKLEITENVDETITDWALSVGSDWDTWTCMSAVVNSFDSSTGLGTSGYVHFQPGGFTRLAVSGDYEYHNSQSYSEVLVPSPLGADGNLVDDVETLNAWVMNLNSQLRQGGLKYSADSTAAGVTITAPEYGWRTDLLC